MGTLGTSTDVQDRLLVGRRRTAVWNRQRVVWGVGCAAALIGGFVAASGMVTGVAAGRVTGRSAAARGDRLGPDALLQLGAFAGYAEEFRSSVWLVQAVVAVPRVLPRSRARSTALTWIGARGTGSAASAPFIQVGVQEARSADPTRDLYYAFWSDQAEHFRILPLFAVGAGDRLRVDLEREGRQWIVPRASAAATRCADARACAGTEPERGDRADAPARSTTPGADRSTAARADAWRPPSPSSLAASCPSDRRSQPTRPDAPQRRRAGSPPRETASRSLPPTRPRALRHQTAPELPHRDPVRRRDSRTADLAGERVDPLRRDLRPVLIHPHHDRHQTPTLSPAQRSSTRRSKARRAGHRIPWNTAGTSVRLAGRAAAIRARL